ncbi:MAG: hypothetical protein M0R17_00300 [Candidatus Omnitrophica bacterium]|jgi:hypothetical protein|nr:hypothetical protein [Candidatus Omnitrophota bacterium]
MEKTDFEIMFDEEYKLENLINIFEKDSVLPEKIEDLMRYNLGTGLLFNKWLSKLGRTSIKLNQLKNKLNIIENKIKQKCRYDETFNEHRVIDKTEMLEKIALDSEYISIRESISKLEVIYNLLKDYVEYFKYINAKVSNQVELIKTSLMAY